MYHRSSSGVSIETLEQRQLLSVSVSLTVGNLVITGNSRNDIVRVSLAGNGDHVDATVTYSVGTSLKTAEFNNVTALSMDTGAGNDSVRLTGKGVGSLPACDIALGSGNDKLYIRPFDGSVYVNAGLGNDLIDASLALTETTAADRTIFRSLHGSSGNDTLVGSIGNDYLYGDSGNDRLYGGGGDDGLYGYAGNDVLYGQAGNDDLNGGTGSNILSGGLGNDTFLEYSLKGITSPASQWTMGGQDRIYGGDGEDMVVRGFNSALGKAVFGYRTISSVEQVISVDHVDDNK